jgi:hypothetical protein
VLCTASSQSCVMGVYLLLQVCNHGTHEITAFAHCAVQVACGLGNVIYVAIEVCKRVAGRE